MKISIICGVTGCGKTTLALKMSIESSNIFLEGDDFHSASNKNKMRNGMGLNDDDRSAWLSDIAKAVLEVVDKDVVLSCSCLKKRYRDFLREQFKGSQIEFIVLNPARKVIEARLQDRHDHFARESLLDSQYADLELPDLNEELDCRVVV